MYSQAAVSSASVAARAVLRWDGTPEKGGPGRPGLAGTFGGSCLWGCLSGSRVVRGSSSGASWRVGRGRFAGREASAVGGLLPARRRGLGACSSLPSGVAGAVCSVRLGLVRGASRRPWRRSFGWGGGGKGTSPGCAVGSCGGRTRPLVARVTRSVAIGAQRSQAEEMLASATYAPRRATCPTLLVSWTSSSKSSSISRSIPATLSASTTLS